MSRDGNFLFTGPQKRMFTKPLLDREMEDVGNHR